MKEKLQNIAQRKTVCVCVVASPSTSDNYNFLKGMSNLVRRSGYKLKICHEYMNRGDRWMQVRKGNESRSLMLAGRFLFHSSFILSFFWQQAFQLNELEHLEILALHHLGVYMEYIESGLWKL